MPTFDRSLIRKGAYLVGGAYGVTDGDPNLINKSLPALSQPLPAASLPVPQGSARPDQDGRDWADFDASPGDDPGDGDPDDNYDNLKSWLSRSGPIKEAHQ